MDDKPDLLSRQRALRPVHALPVAEREAIGVAARRGRPKKIEAAPPEPDQYAVDLDGLRQEAIRNDPLVAGAEADGLTLAMLELAREAACLKYERRRLELLGRDGAAQVSSRRVDALARLGSLCVERNRWQPDECDVRGEKFGKIVTSFMEVLNETAEETLGADAESFMTAYRAKLVGWQDKVDPPRTKPPSP